MAEINSGKKIIAVSNGTERETYLLKKILDSSRRDVFTVVPAGEAMERGTKAAVLLASEPAEFPAPEFFPVCVTAFAPSRRQELAGFRKVVTYSTEWNGADFTARNIRTLPNGVTAFEIVGVGIIGRVRLGPDCAKDVEAALAAAATATVAGIPFAEALEALNGSQKT
jgi:hypothetical protein